jgi:ABC-type glutathione transport system ATPase component
MFKPHGAAGFCKHPEHRKGEKDQRYKQVNDTACTEFSETIVVKKEYIKTVQDIPVETIDPQPLTIQELIEEYRKNLYVEEDINISLPLAFAVSNHSLCDPDALGIIGPSGSGKTNMCILSVH